MDRQRRLPPLIGLAVVVVAGGVALVAWGRRLAAVRPAGDEALADAAASLSHLRTSPVFVANHGKLVGAFNGFAWVVASEGVRIDTPNPCNERACFRGTDGALCSRGTISAPSCAGATPAAALAPCPREAWAVKIGWDVRREGGPWGPQAKPQISLDYRGTRHARLAAHRSGDPAATEYCVDDYASGELVGAERFREDCWKERGKPLASFEGVDKFILELPASGEPGAFDVCVTAIHVAEPADAGAL
jgi:HAMP domain-containing protein